MLLEVDQLASMSAASPTRDEGDKSSRMEFSYLQRVKVYRLNDDGKWDDKGTGHVSVEYLERSGSLGMVVLDEEENSTLLVHRISPEDIYRRQDDTIISWKDPDVASDLALSFQEAMGCGFVWEQIMNVQRSAQFPNPGALETGPREELEHSGTSQDDDDVFHDSGKSEISALPPVELSSLPQIVKTIDVLSSADKDRVASLVMGEQNYIHKLLELFRICEDLENIEGLVMLFKIAKGLILLNDRHIFDVIFSDDFMMDIVGALEYDPDLPSHQDHRGFLKNQVVFKEAVPVRDPAIVSRIHQTYRLGYIKDVILPRVLDEQTFATLNSMIMSNNKGIITALHNDKNFTNDLFEKLRGPDLSESTRRELILFLHEFCNLSKNMQPFHRTELFCSLVQKGLFEVMTDALQSEDSTVRVSGCDVLIVLLNHDASLLRTFLVEQPGHVLFSLLVKSMITPGEGGLQAQLLEIMRMLLETDTTDRQQVDKSAYLDLFYDKYMDQLVEVLTSACPTKATTTDQAGTLVDSPATAEILGNICELMCFCVLHHGYRIKYYVMRNNVVEKVLRLVRRKEKFLVVAAVRFLRVIVGLRDDFYDRYLVKNNLFEPVIQAFLANGNRYNLLNSAVLELIDCIRKANTKILVSHLVEKYYRKLQVVDYVDTIQQLKREHEQSMEGDSAPPREAETLSERFVGPLPDSRKRKDDRALDKDEEDYFNEDSISDDEEDSASAPDPAPSVPQAIVINGNSLPETPFRHPLVNYDDEDDDFPVANGKDRLTGRKHEEGIESLPLTKRKSSSATDAPVEISFQKKHKPEIHAKQEVLEPRPRQDTDVRVETEAVASKGDKQPETTARSTSSGLSSRSSSGQVVVGCKVHSDIKPRISSEPSSGR